MRAQAMYHLVESLRGVAGIQSVPTGLAGSVAHSTIGRADRKTGSPAVDDHAEHN
jgi:hypothetical protein